MQRIVFAGVVLAVAGLLGIAGCRDKVRESGTAEKSLERLHRHWNAAREGLKTDNPSLSVFRAIDTTLGYATPQRIKDDYTGANKDQILAKLEEVYKLFKDELGSKLNLNAPTVTLGQGATIEDVRQAFDRVDQKYRELEEMSLD